MRAGIVANLVKLHCNSPWLGSVSATRPSNLLLVSNNLDEVANGIDHAADGRRVFKRSGTAYLAEPKPAQCRGLDVGLAIGAADLAHDERLLGFLVSH